MRCSEPTRKGAGLRWGLIWANQHQDAKSQGSPLSYSPNHPTRPESTRTESTRPESTRPDPDTPSTRSMTETTWLSSPAGDDENVVQSYNLHLALPSSPPQASADFWTSALAAVQPNGVEGTHRTQDLADGVPRCIPCLLRHSKVRYTIQVHRIGYGQRC